VAFTEVDSLDIVTKAQKVDLNQFPTLLERRVERSEEGRAFFPLGKFPERYLYTARKFSF
jgi:hypothetical protein